LICWPLKITDLELKHFDAALFAAVYSSGDRVFTLGEQATNENVAIKPEPTKTNRFISFSVI
jgi:hypothetical protein